MPRPLVRGKGVDTLPQIAAEGGGPVRDEASADPGVQGTRRFLELLAASFQVTATAVQTVAEGYNGFAMALVMADPRGVCPSRIVRC